MTGPHDAMQPTLEQIAKFLCGEEPLMGCWYGDGTKPARERGSFWWRRYLRAALSTSAPQCPACKGSGTVKGMTQGHGPDDYEVDVECPRCGGTGAALSETQRGDTAMLVERIHQFDAAIRRIAEHVGAVCGGVDTGPLGGHTADEIIRCIDVLRSNGGTAKVPEGWKLVPVEPTKQMCAGKEKE